MPISFARDVCCSLEETISREWLITNGLGGYAAGTVVGTLTRLQQGLLVVPSDHEQVPQLLVAKIDEEIHFDQRTYYLGTNEYQDGTLNPAGFVHLESFRLEEGFPIFTYRLGGIDGVLLEKRIWMRQEQHTTYIQYRVLRTSAASQVQASNLANWRGRDQSGYNGHARPYASLESARAPLTLTLLPLVAYRPYDQPQYGNYDWHFHVQALQAEGEAPEEQEISLPRGATGCTVRATEKSAPYHILVMGDPRSNARFIPTGVWYWRFLHRHNQSAGLPPTDDLYLPGVIRAQLWPDKDATLTVVVTTTDLDRQPFSQKQLNHSYDQALDYQRSLLQAPRYFGEGGGSIQSLPILPLSDSADSPIKSDEFLQLLHQAGDHLLARRVLPYQDRAGEAAFFLRAGEQIAAITPGYYKQDDQIREMLIALPGLTLATRRHSEAQRLLRTIGRYFRKGLLPSRLPSANRPLLEDTDYDTVDTTLWYFYALDKYLGATHDYDLLEELYLRLTECTTHYIQGTFHGIQVDPTDGLLRTSTTERPLTWMNACAHGIPVTLRTGKAVEVNALWYNALCLMHEWSQLLYQRGRALHPDEQYARLSEQCRQSFNQRFWHAENGYLYDLIDDPTGNDDARLRPNQLLAISLRHAVLADLDQQAAVLNAITQHLLTPYGLRTLASHEPGYQGQLPPHHEELPLALHQGAVWPWLIGPYIDALLLAGDWISPDGAHRTANSDLYKEYVWRRGLQILEPFRQHMQQDMLGNISSTYAGDAPHQSGPQLASALSIGEILRTYKALAHMGMQHLNRVISA